MVYERRGHLLKNKANKFPISQRIMDSDCSNWIGQNKRLKKKKQRAYLCR